MLRRRLLALFLDALLCASIADAAGLGSTALVWRYLPAAREAIPWMWLVLALGTIAGFLLRDARGGRARRWMALEAQGPDGRAPGAWGSLRRNLPLLLPGWNVYDAWPALFDGSAPRRTDCRTRTRILSGI